MTTPDSLSARTGELLNIGTTPDQVANSLQATGIRGVRNASGFFNPIVMMVRQNILDALRIEVTGDSLRIFMRDGQEDEVSLPQAVREFLDLFSLGFYPELDGLRCGPTSPVRPVRHRRTGMNGHPWASAGS